MMAKLEDSLTDSVTAESTLGKWAGFDGEEHVLDNIRDEMEEREEERLDNDTEDDESSNPETEDTSFVYDGDA